MDDQACGGMWATVRCLSIKQEVLRTDLRRAASFLTLAGFLWLASGCSESVPASMPSQQIDGASSQASDTVPIPPCIEDAVSELQWIGTKENEMENRQMDVYADKEGNQFIYDHGDGSIRGFYKGIDSDRVVSAVKDEEELKNIAETFLKAFIPFDLYTFVNHTYTQDTNVHTFGYSREIAGYKSADIAFVILTDDGEFVGYAAPNVGIFEQCSIPEIDEAALKEKLEAAMTRKRPFSAYTIDNRIWNMTDQSELEMIFEVTVVRDGQEERETYHIPL